MNHINPNMNEYILSMGTIRTGNEHTDEDDDRWRHTNLLDQPSLQASCRTLVAQWDEQADQYDAATTADWAAGTWGARMMSAKALTLRQTIMMLNAVLEGE